MTKHLSVRIIINPKAGWVDRTAEITREVKRIFSSSEGFFEIKCSTKEFTPLRLTEEAASRAFSGVVICGGDGTVREVSTALVESRTTLGIVPTGSKNSIAVGLGIPEKIAPALRLIKGARPKIIDVGRIAGRYFLLSAGVGFDAALSAGYRKAGLEEKKPPLLPLLSKEYRSIRRYPPAPLVIKCNGETRHLLPFILRFANFGHYAGHSPIALGADPSDGLLNVLTVPLMEARDSTRLVRSALKEEISLLPGFREFTTEGPVVVDGRGPRLLHADGEPFEWSGGFEVTLLPKALSLWTL